MKKSFIMLFALLATLSLSATQYAFIGGSIGWTYDNARNYVFHLIGGETNLYTITINEIYGDIKLVDVDAAEWSVQYGAYQSGQSIAKGGNYGLKAKNGTDEPQNLTIGGAVYKYTDATFTLEVQENGSLVLNFVSGTTALRDDATVQIVGDYNSWKLEDAVQFEANGEGVLCATIPSYKGSSKLVVNRSWTGAYGSNGTLMSVGTPYVLASNGGNLFCTNPFLVYTDVQLTLTFGNNDEVILTAVGGTVSTTEYEIPQTLRLTGTAFSWSLEDEKQIMQPVDGVPYTYSLTCATIKGDLKLTNGTWEWFFGKNADGDKWVVNKEYTMGFLTDNLQATSDTEYTDVTITVVLDVENGTAKLTIRDTDSPTALSEPVLSNRATKRIENGQLIIIKNGVRYNALGSLL
ncbi:MAG: hypothetical protein ACI4BD_01340 [Paludibacteraceae bacterium]